MFTFIYRDCAGIESTLTLMQLGYVHPDGHRPASGERASLYFQETGEEHPFALECNENMYDLDGDYVSWQCLEPATSAPAAVLRAIVEAWSRGSDVCTPTPETAARIAGVEWAERSWSAIPERHRGAISSVGWRGTEADARTIAYSAGGAKVIDLDRLAPICNTAARARWAELCAMASTARS